MRSIYSSVKFYLVTQMGISNKDAQLLFDNQVVLVNGYLVNPKQKVERTDEIIVNQHIIKQAEKLRYYAYHKPPGVECTLNTQIINNLVDTLSLPRDVFPIGRLDKDSEGLLLLTNDGTVYNQIIHSSQHQEKEYIVSVDKPITDEFIHEMSSGVIIMGQVTRPCKVYKIADNSFGIILTQGLNRQIRRMCYKLNYKVLTLKRIRVMQIQLGNLSLGELKEISKIDILGFY